MEFRYNNAYSTPFTSSSSYINFSDRAPEERSWVGRSVGGGRWPESFRELEKRRIREEIIAEGMERKRVLEAVVRRELTMEREMMPMHSHLGFASSFMPGPPYNHHNRFQPGVLHDEFGGVEVVPFQRLPQSPIISEITTSRPKVDEKRVIGLGKPKVPTISGSKRKPSSQAPGGATTDEWSCALCKVSVTSERDLHDHLAGKKHQAKAAGLRGNHAGKTEKCVNKEEPKSVQMDSREDKMPKGEGSRKKFRFWCKLCRVGASDKKVMSKHKKGKKHLKNLLKNSR
ncbi:hypothetical protein L2E82_03391 [Cichorium intybus]|uniref:Uncharacterized protein n=1 Tax=Cichorium intybus TaxID=13427 RepID=A0ACB9H4V8_CICIN|nr:hypothetical protein L2E82_03391 [Cichorium intybus]